MVLINTDMMQTCTRVRYEVQRGEVVYWVRGKLMFLTRSIFDTERYWRSILEKDYPGEMYSSHPYPPSCLFCVACPSRLSLPCLLFNLLPFRYRAVAPGYAKYRHKWLQMMRCPTFQELPGASYRSSITKFMYDLPSFPSSSSSLFVSSSWREWAGLNFSTTYHFCRSRAEILSHSFISRSNSGSNRRNSAQEWWHEEGTTLFTLSFHPAEYSESRIRFQYSVNVGSSYPLCWFLLWRS